MTIMQELLNKEAYLSNTGKASSKERQKIINIIKEKRSLLPAPDCYGEDDCSTSRLLICPRRIDCGD